MNTNSNLENHIRKIIQEIVQSLMNNVDLNTTTFNGKISKLLCLVNGNEKNFFYETELYMKVLRTQSINFPLKVCREKLTQLIEGYSYSLVWPILIEELENQVRILPDYNFYNYLKLKEVGRLDLLYSFDTNFRGNIKYINRLPFNNMLIFETLQGEEIQYYVSQQQYILSIESFKNARLAIAFCLSERYYDAIMKLSS